MLKKTITFQNVDGDTVTRDVYFNISANELVEKEASSDQTYSEKLKAIGESAKLSEIYPVVMEFLEQGYGLRTADGDFEKDPSGREWARFRNSLAYEALMDELLLDPNENGSKLADFINGMLPANLVAAAREQNATPGFRPGADTGRPTPPVSGQQPVDLGEVPSERYDPEVTQPMPVPPEEVYPIDYGQAADPSVVIQTSTPREPELPGAATQQ